MWNIFVVVWNSKNPPEREAVDLVNLNRVHMKGEGITQPPNPTVFSAKRSPTLGAKPLLVGKIRSVVEGPPFFSQVVNMPYSTRDNAPPELVFSKQRGHRQPELCLWKYEYVVETFHIARRLHSRRCRDNQLRNKSLRGGRGACCLACYTVYSCRAHKPPLVRHCAPTPRSSHVGQIIDSHVMI